MATEESSGPVLLFDGVCNLCHSLVRFTMERDSGTFRFASLQSEAARELLAETDLPADYAESIVLLTDEGCYTRSAAALKAARYLDWPWPLLYSFVYLPAPIRDFVYELVANRRYDWFGRRSSCAMSKADTADRFVE